MKRSILASTAALSLCLIAAFSTSACLQGAPLEEESVEAIKKARGCDMEALHKRCALAGCHDTAASAITGLDLTTSNFPNDLIGLEAVYLIEDPDEAATCPTTPELIIDPANPLQSLLLKKIRGEQTCGDPMPLTTPLDEGAIQCFEEWTAGVVA